MRIFEGSHHRKWRTQLSESRLPAVISRRVYARVMETIGGQTKWRKEEDQRVLPEGTRALPCSQQPRTVDTDPRIYTSC